MVHTLLFEYSSDISAMVSVLGKQACAMLADPDFWRQLVTCRRYMAYGDSYT